MNKIKFIMLLSLVLSAGVEARVAGKSSSRTGKAFDKVVVQPVKYGGRALKKLAKGLQNLFIKGKGKVQPGLSAGAKKIRECGALCVSKLVKIYEATEGKGPIARSIRVLSIVKNKARSLFKRNKAKGDLAEVAQVVQDAAVNGSKVAKEVAESVTGATVRANGGKPAGEVVANPNSNARTNKGTHELIYGLIGKQPDAAGDKKIPSEGSSASAIETLIRQGGKLGEISMSGTSNWTSAQKTNLANIRLAIIRSSGRVDPVTIFQQVLGISKPEAKQRVEEARNCKIIL